jgi:hypothetical protein
VSQLFDITHDDNNLDEYDLVVDDGGDLSTGTPGLAGTTAKMEAMIDDTTAIYGEKNFSLTTDDFRVRIYLDPNSADYEADDNHRILDVHDDSDSALQMFLLYLRHDGSNFELRLAAGEDDTGEDYSDTYDISDAVHYVEIWVERATSDVAGDGDCTLWIDEVQKWNQGGTLDNYDLFPLQDRCRVGAWSFGGTPTGTVHLDEILANDDGSEIGPVAGIAGPLVGRVPVGSLVHGGLV